MANYPPNVAGVASISSGTGVIVNNADPENPIVGITSPVVASNGGTGLSTSGTDATKYLKSNGSGGWTLATPAVTAGVSSVTASSPLASSGGSTPDISLSGTVGASNGGTGLATSGTDATKYLKSDGAGNWELSTPAGGGGSPGGSSGNIQYNNGSGGFGAESALTYDASGDVLTAPSVKMSTHFNVSLNLSTGSNQTIGAGDSIGPATKMVWAIDAASAVSTSTSNPIDLLTSSDYGRVLWLLNVGENAITLKAGGTTLLDGNVDLVMAPFSIAKFMFIPGPEADVWTQTDKMITVL